MGDRLAILEKDWKYFRGLKEIILDRFAETTLSHISTIIGSKKNASKHEKYLEIYQYIQKRDKILEYQLSDWRRSTAKLKIAEFYRMGLITDDELNHFSDEIKDFINLINAI